MQNKKYSIIITLCLLVCVQSCNNTPIPTVITNSSFETGSIKGWDVVGNAFVNKGVIFDDKDSKGNYYNQVGDFFYHGGEALAGATGTMISNEFILSGNGKIGFLIGAGKNFDDCYVALIDSNGKELVTRGNYEFDEVDSASSMHRVILDGSNFIGEKVRIKVIDNDPGVDGYNYINIDDFIIDYQGVVEPVGKVSKAYKYILENMNSVGQKYRHTYHAMSPLGWSNDPNGLIWYQDKGHLFFQYNPYDSVWGPMHWGHYTTNDFVKWELQPVALAPDQDYDKDYGAFSGTAIEKEGKLYLMYTAVANNLQQQALAVSSDGIVFEKLNRNPVITSTQVPIGASTADFRDPKVFYKDGYYYCLVGTRMNGYGMILLYKSTNLTSWQYVGKVMNNSNINESNYYQLNGVYECPDFITLGGQEVLIFSPQNLPKNGSSFENVHSVVYTLGNMNYQTGKFSYDKMQEFDGGFDFYAAQTMKLPDGRTILIAWMQMWDRTLVTQIDNWVGAYTLPRELTLKDNHIYQTPIKEIENYRQNEVNYLNQELTGNLVLPNVTGTKVELNIELDVGNASKTGVKLFKGSYNETLVYYDAASETVIFDRSHSGKSIKGAESNDYTRSEKVTLSNGKLKLRIFLDVSSVEVFINDGYVTMSGNVYPEELDTGIVFYSEGGISTLTNLTKYDIVVS